MNIVRMENYVNIRNMLLIPVFVILFLIISYFIYGAYKVKVKRWLYIKKSQQHREKWSNLLEDHFEYFKMLDLNRREKFLDYISIMMLEKSWSQSFDTKDKVIESAKACLPIINRPTNFYPMIKSINEKKEFRQWLELLEAQFQIDHGKSILREFNDNFSEFSYQYFQKPTELKESEKKIYYYLNHFYKHYPN